MFTFQSRDPPPRLCSATLGPTAAATPPLVNPRWASETPWPRPLRQRPAVASWFGGVRSVSPTSTRSALSQLTQSRTAAASRRRETAGEGGGATSPRLASPVCHTHLSSFRLQVAGRQRRQQEQRRGRELQPRVVSEPWRPGGEAAAAPHADTPPGVGATGRQRGRQEAGRGRSYWTEGVRSETVQESSGGRDAAEGEGATGERHLRGVCVCVWEGQGAGPPGVGSLISLHVCSSQSSLSVGSDLDLTDTPTPAYPLRRSWDANQEGAGLEVNISTSTTPPLSVHPAVRALTPPLSVSRC